MHTFFILTLSFSYQTSLKPQFLFERFHQRLAGPVTLPKTKIAPENGWLEDEMFFWEGLFSGDVFVSGRVSTFQVPAGWSSGQLQDELNRGVRSEHLSVLPSVEKNTFLES